MLEHIESSNTITFPDRILNLFWSHVEKGDSCWLWTGHTTSDGYGQYRPGSSSDGVKQWRAHRFAWQITFGNIPHGMLVCHKCDTPVCVNPDHLFIGTVVDNRDDCCSKHRQAIGANNGRHTHPERTARGGAHGCVVLTEDMVREIRRRYSIDDISQDALSIEFGVSQMTVSLIVRRESWRHI
jgi:hypothetical protein